MRGISNNFGKSFKNLGKNLKKLRPEVWLVLIIIFALLLRLHFFTGLNWSDDPGYVSDAHRVLNGNFYLGSYLSGLRIMMIYPIAFFFFLFGVSNLSAALYPLITSLGSIVIIFYLGKFLFNEKVGLLSAFFLSFFPLNIAYATWPMPDVPIAFFGALSILLFFKAQKVKKERFRKLDKRKLLFLISGLIIGISHLLKVSGMVILFFIVPYMVYKVLKKRKIDFDYLFLFLGIGLILFLEGSFYFLSNGNFFTRYDVVSSFYVPGRAGINSDLNFYPMVMFNLLHDLSFNFNNIYFVHYGLFYYLIVISFVYIIIKRDKRAFIPLLWFLLLFSYLELGSMSFTEYIPIHKLPRHLTVLTIPGLLCLSYFLIDFLKGKKLFIAKKTLFLFIIGFIFITSIFYTYHRSEYLDASTWDMKEIYTFSKNYPEKNIYCDIGSLSHLRFYYKFENDEYIKDLSFIKNEIEIKDSFVILNGSRSVIENTLGANELPKFIYNLSKDWELVKVISGPEIDIYARYDPRIYYVPS